MTAERTYALRFIPLEVSTVSATYGGAGAYGELSYGQQASDPLSNMEYVATPTPGEYSVSPAWVFRTGNVGTRFNCTILGLDGPMNLTPIASAVLVIERLAAGPRTVRAYTLTVDDTNDVVYRDWLVGDLDVTGLFRVLVQITSSTGRRMTIDATDNATMTIRTGDTDAVV